MILSKHFLQLGFSFYFHLIKKSKNNLFYTNVPCIKVQRCQLNFFDKNVKII